MPWTQRGLQTWTSTSHLCDLWTPQSQKLNQLSPNGRTLLFMDFQTVLTRLITLSTSTPRFEAEDQKQQPRRMIA